MSAVADTFAANAAKDQGTGFGDYFAILKRRRRLMLALAIPIIAIAVLLACTLPSIYRSTGTVQVDKDENLKNVVDQNSQEAPYVDEYVQALSTRVLTGKNLKQLLATERLYPDQDTADPVDVLQRLRKDIRVDIVTVPILDPNNSREREIVNAFSVSLDNRDPAVAQRGAKWLVRAFLQENRHDRETQAASASKFFSGEAERMRSKVAELEGKLAVFKGKNVGQLPEYAGANMNVMDRTERDIQDIETQMQALRHERVFLVSQLSQARSVGTETTTLRSLQDEYDRKRATYDESHPDMVALRRQIDQLRATGSLSSMSLPQQLQMKKSILAEVRQRYSEDHPDVKRIERDIQSLQSRIAAGESANQVQMPDSPQAMQLQTQINATDTQLAALQSRSAELRAKMSDLEGKMSVAPQVEREYQAVTRDLASARSKYDDLLRRQMDAEVSEAAIAGGSSDKFHISSSPQIPDQSIKPQRIAIVAVAFVLAVMAALSAAIIAQMFDSTVRSARDVESALEVTPLVSVPVIENSGAAAVRRRSLVILGIKEVVAIAVGYVALWQVLT